MTAAVPVAMFGWPPLVLALFVLLRPRHAVIAALVTGWLFLPNAAYSLAGLPDYTKLSATVLGAFIGASIFDPRSILSVRPAWFDLPITILCLSPFASSLANGLGAYNGLSEVLSSTIQWGLPYLLGRAYLKSLDCLRELAIGILIGGIVYMPLCLWEIRMSPGLHKGLYGFRPRLFGMGQRYGGYRPQVFMWTYIPVVYWLTISTVIAAWLRLRGGLRDLMGIPMSLILPGLLITLVLCKTAVAFVLVPLGLAIPLTTVKLRTSLPLVLLVLAALTYITVRATGVWSARELVSIAEMMDPARAFTLEQRITNEDQMGAKARQRPLFGWGGYGRSRVVDDKGRDITMSDGRWIITFGRQGLVGLVAFAAVFAVPLIRFARAFPPITWSQCHVAGAAAIAVVVALTLVNNLPNSTAAPVVPFAIGGLATISVVRRLIRSSLDKNDPRPGLTNHSVSHAPA